MYKPHLTKYEHVHVHVIDVPGYLITQVVWVNQKGVKALHGSTNYEVYPSSPMTIPIMDASNKEKAIWAFLRATAYLNKSLENALTNQEVENDTSSKVAN